MRSYHAIAAGLLLVGSLGAALLVLQHVVVRPTEAAAVRAHKRHGLRRRVSLLLLLLLLLHLLLHLLLLLLR